MKIGGNYNNKIPREIRDRKRQESKPRSRWKAWIYALWLLTARILSVAIPRLLVHSVG